MRHQNAIFHLHRIPVLLLVMLACASPAIGQAGRSLYEVRGDPELKLDREYPIKVEVDLVLAGTRLLFDEKTVGRICQKRLEAARLPVAPDSTGGPSNSLFVNLVLLRDTVNITVAFARLTPTKVGNETFLRKTTVWTTNAAGLHNDNEYLVEEGLKAVVDRFVTAYHLANPDLRSATISPAPSRSP